jgi:hypothetical protein
MKDIKRYWGKHEVKGTHVNYFLECKLVVIMKTLWNYLSLKIKNKTTM